MASEPRNHYPELPTATAWLEIYKHFNRLAMILQPLTPSKTMLTDSQTEEQIADNQEIQDSLIIPVRTLPLPSKRACSCGHCKHLNHISASMLEQPGGQYGPDEISIDLVETLVRKSILSEQMTM